jgi:ferric-dicitrate binding protein FerR (iron transport regulator)
MQEKVTIPEDLLLKYIKGELKEEERIQLTDWLSQAEQNKLLFEYITNDKNLEEELKKFRSSNPENVRAKLSAEWPAAKAVKIRRLPGWTYIAAASVLIAVASYLVIIKKHTTATTNNAQPVAIVQDVAPGKYKAKLKLADGSVVYLDSTNNQIIGQQGSIAVKNKNGQLIYEQKGKQNEILYNTLSTAKGETYATVLSDGSKVWLNSESSIHYPVAFDGDVRKVEITGEAYFEVAPSVAVLANKQKGKRPFVVDAPGLEVEVLGTHFDINSYGDEEVSKTTLLQGKVRVHATANASETILQPDEQAQIDKQTNDLKKITGVDADGEVAWRYGYFQFNDADIPTVMRQLERWYDVQTVYEGTIPKREFLGKIPRSLTLSQALNVLQMLKVHFKIEGKKIIVSP